MDHLHWRHPFTSILAGPSGSEKTVFVSKFLKNLKHLSDTPIERIIFYYAEWQQGYRDLGDNVEFKEGLPQPMDYSSDPRTKLIIIDDLMSEASSSGNIISNLFTKGSHHNNLSVIFITQNIFHQGKNSRDISLNAQYVVLFRNLRDRSQIQHLSRQLCPENSRFVQEAYNDATRDPYGYFLIDLKQNTPNSCRFRTFPEDEYNFVYVSKNSIKNIGGEYNVPVLSV